MWLPSWARWRRSQAREGPCAQADVEERRCRAPVRRKPFRCGDPPCGQCRSLPQPPPAPASAVRGHLATPAPAPAPCGPPRHGISMGRVRAVRCDWTVLACFSRQRRRRFGRSGAFVLGAAAPCRGPCATGKLKWADARRGRKNIAHACLVSLPPCRTLTRETRMLLATVVALLTNRFSPSHV